MPDKKYRLLTRCEIDGAIREPGYIFTKPEDWRGPHKTVVASDHGADLRGPPHHDRRHAPANIADHPGHMNNLRDEPLYAEVVENAPPKAAPVMPDVFAPREPGDI